MTPITHLTRDKKIARIIEAARAAKARDICALDMRGVSSLYDYFVIASGDSTTHTDAISGRIARDLREAHIHVQRVEGRREARWILLDYGDIIVHIFHRDTRNYYNLEKLWHDVPHVPCDEGMR